MTTPALSTDLGSIQAVEDQLRQAVNNSIDDLAPKIAMLTRQIDEHRNQLVALLENPIPASDFPGFISSYIDRLAAKGADQVLAHITDQVAHVREFSRESDARPRFPLPFHRIEELVTGNRTDKVAGVSPRVLEKPANLLPRDKEGAISDEVMAFVCGDLLKEKLCALLEKQPITYTNKIGGYRIGAGIVERRAAIDEVRTKLQALEDEKTAREAEMRQLQQKKRVLA